jgi:hypothetical protein
MQYDGKISSQFLPPGGSMRPVYVLYDNEYASIIDIYFYEYFHCSQSFSACAPNLLDTLSDILDKCLHFSLIRIEPASSFQAQQCLVPSSQSVVYTCLLKMLSLVLIKN